mmetsp:Transcript_35858/g.89974  ORF Transcript_35858/g.89974 Transcript_35858/m.89974 type:complete len:253 (+) Transcript_35858:713-1471(+)
MPAFRTSACAVAPIRNDAVVTMMAASTMLAASTGCGVAISCAALTWRAIVCASRLVASAWAVGSSSMMALICSCRISFSCFFLCFCSTRSSKSSRRCFRPESKPVAVTKSPGGTNFRRNSGPWLMYTAREYGRTSLGVKVEGTMMYRYSGVTSTSMATSLSHSYAVCSTTSYVFKLSTRVALAAMSGERAHRSMVSPMRVVYRASRSMRRSGCMSDTNTRAFLRTIKPYWLLLLQVALVGSPPAVPSDQRSW